MLHNAHADVGIAEVTCTVRSSKISWFETFLEGCVCNAARWRGLLQIDFQQQPHCDTKWVAFSFFLKKRRSGDAFKVIAMHPSPGIRPQHILKKRTKTTGKTFSASYLDFHIPQGHLLCTVL